MKVQGHLTNLTLDTHTKHPIASLELVASPEDVEKYMDKPLDIEIVKHSKRRSLSANAYFHVLAGKIAGAIGTSNTEIKNLLLRRYGQVEIYHGKPATIISEIPPEEMIKREDIHCAGYAYKVEDGKTYTSYLIYRGSHTYNTEEMAKLIDGTISEAKEMGIETLTPDEIARMTQSWKAQDEKHYQG